MSQEQSIDAAVGQSSPVIVREDMTKYTAPISNGRKLYFYTFGDEKLDLPEGSVVTKTSEDTDV